MEERTGGAAAWVWAKVMPGVEARSARATAKTDGTLFRKKALAATNTRRIVTPEPCSRLERYPVPQFVQPVIEHAQQVFLFPPPSRDFRRRRGGYGRWGAGALLALAVHLAAGVAIVGLAPKERFEDWPDGSGGSEVVISLHDADGRVRGPQPPAAATASPLDALRDSLAASQAPQAAGAGAGTPESSLSELFGESAKASPAGGSQGGARDSGGGSGARPGFDYGAQASVPRRRPGAGEGPVGPCWGRPERPVPVIMAILLDKDGVLVGRPRIIKVGDGPGDPRAADYERTAMRAMAGCAPFSLAPPGVYEAYRIDFSREKGGLIRLGPMAAP